MVVISFLIGLMILISPIAILVSIVLAFIRRNKEDKESLEQSAREIYVYIILIISLLIIILGVITSFRVGLDVLLPEKSQSSYYSDEQTRNENIIELTTTSSLVATAIPIFIYHNKIAKSTRKIKKEEVDNNK